MALIAAPAPSTLLARLQIGAGRWHNALESWLEAERDQLFLWLPVAIGAGIALWFALPDARAWTLALLLCASIAASALFFDPRGRAGRTIAIGAVAVAVGIGLVWWRSERVAAPVIAAPAVVRIEAVVERIERLPARGLVRLRLIPRRLIEGRSGTVLPPRVRLNLPVADVPAGTGAGAVIALGARLLPPPPPAVPGAYDYARVAWFDGIGATGRGFGPVVLRQPAPPENDLRARLSAHIQARLPGSAGGIAAALATGDQGAIALDDAEAMRRSGLAHLLSVSGLHITAVVAATMWLALRLLALSPWLALRVRLPLVAAGAGAAAAIGYTLLTGAEVPTVRSCVAALLVLTAIAIGREAVTLRLVASGALVVLALWPESLVGASFQLSFAAVAAIVALHESPTMRGWFAAREEPWGRRFARGTATLLATGLVVEAVLAPIGLFHFHKAGLYGSLANIVAIPLTTFVIMPLEAAALAADAAGLGAPSWWLAGRALDLLLGIARAVAAAPGAVAVLPSMPPAAFAAMIGGGLWLGLWRTRVRALGFVAIAAGVIGAALAPAPDLLVTGDGRHVALRTSDGELALLRERAGDYTRAMLAENAGVDGEPLLFDDLRDARCSADLCLAQLRRGGRAWRVLATRSAYPVDRAALLRLCAGADIVVSDRRLPRACTPRWLKLDRPALAASGGAAITLAPARIATVADPADHHPWRTAALPRRSGAANRPDGPARAPARGDNAADHKRGSPDRAAPWRLRGGNI